MTRMHDQETVRTALRLLTSLYEGLGLSREAIANQLGIPSGDLAGHLDNRKGHEIGAVLESRIGSQLAILELVGRHLTTNWILGENSNPLLQGRTPFQLIQENKEDVVLTYLRGIYGGWA